MNKCILQRIRHVIGTAVDSRCIAGASVLVYKGGGEQYYTDAGYADIEKNVLIRRDTIFRMYSMTKPVTGAAVMLLCERGLLDLLDPVSKYLPGFIGQHVVTGLDAGPVKREVTILDLLSMTAGTPYPNPNSMAGIEATEVFDLIASRQNEGNPFTTVELANTIGRCGLDFHPGERWMYGTCADIAGAIVEVASGKGFGQFLHEEFFTPLGMNDTAFYVPADKQSRLARTYKETESGLVEYKGNHLGILNRMECPPAFESGGAGLASTIDDYMKFARMLMGGGKLGNVRILSPQTVKYFTSAQLTDEQRKGMADWDKLAGFSYGKFMRILTNPGQAAIFGTVGEYGWDGWLGTYFLCDAKNDLVMLYMTQRTDAGTMSNTRSIRNIVYSALE